MSCRCDDIRRAQNDVRVLSSASGKCSQLKASILVLNAGGIGIYRQENSAYALSIEQQTQVQQQLMQQNTALEHEANEMFCVLQRHIRDLQDEISDMEIEDSAYHDGDEED